MTPMWEYGKTTLLLFDR